MKQKDFVVAEVERILGPRFVKFQTIALGALTKDELELLKERTLQGLRYGQIDYGKANEPLADTRTYARSMVTNHLKKAKELNGNMTFSSSSGVTKATRSEPTQPKGIVMNLLPPELQAYVKEIV